MKAFLMALVAGGIISVAAWFVLGDMGFSSQQVYSTENVRLD